ncbi:MAG TPA: phosphoribosyltransferase family protein [Candidatus Saccharimonadales bacterium]|jgi:hypoxanthine phosphoribosyltransferase|nr:phosphoribosyltransferase family protein [Candidatus Saccharimonadales bacterium]
MDWPGVTELVETVTAQIEAGGWQPTVIVALSRGGFIPATMIAYCLGVKDVLGMDVQKDEAGRRTIGRYVQLKYLTGERALIVDDGIIGGSLLAMTTEAVRANGGEPRTCALTSEGRTTPDYLAKEYPKIPAFPLE